MRADRRRVLAAAQVSVLLFAFLLAAFVRVAQGSATVAMVTAAGLAAPMVAAASLSPARVALVKQYLGLTEAQTLRSWTICATIAGSAMFEMALLLWQVS